MVSTSTNKGIEQMKVTIEKDCRGHNKTEVYENVTNIKHTFFHYDGGSYVTLTHTEDDGNVCELSIDLTDLQSFDVTD